MSDEEAAVADRRRRFRPFRPLREFVARMRRGRKVNTAVGKLTLAELKRVHMIEDKQPRGLSRWLYSVYWWAIFLGVVFLPTSHEEATIFFPGMLTLAVAWLLAMAPYALSLSSADYSMVRPHGVFGAFLRALQEQRIDMPEAMDDPDGEAQMDRYLASATPALIPATILQMLNVLSFRAVVVAVIGLAGVLVGPTLADLHWLHGWSPVAGLIAVIAPLALALLASMLLPFVTLEYMAQLRLNAIEQTLDSPHQGS